MKVSILIVSKNRKTELENTLKILQSYTDLNQHEILVFIDGSTDGSDKLVQQLPWVNWYGSKKSIGASRARHELSKKAKGDIFIGFDDDAHPLKENFVEISNTLFSKNEKVAILAFQEIKGIFKNDNSIPIELLKEKQDYLTKNFIGCGYAIRKDVYFKTRGFPVWVDIYGEEDCLAMEVLDLGYDILYTHKIQVNHRVDRQQRKKEGANLFRFRKQLANTTFFYFIYYPFPLLLKKILKLYFHNFKKYAVTDWNFFCAYFQAFGKVIISIPTILKYRKPVKKTTLAKYQSMISPEY